MRDDYKKKARDLGVPLIPAPAPTPQPTTDSNPPVAVCGLCGMTLHKIMVYACPHDRCPAGLGRTHSMSSPSQ